MTKLFVPQVKVFVYHIPPVDFWAGSWAYNGLFPANQRLADEMLVLFDELHPERYRESARFGFNLSPEDCHTQMWGARKLDNNGTTVLISQVALAGVHEDDVAMFTLTLGSAA